jgi:hypothetical protein
MARSKSSVLTPAEKKNVISDTKNQIKVAQGSLKELNATVTVSQKFTAAAVKEANTASKAAEKLHATVVAAHAKNSAVYTKAIAKLTADLAAMTPAVA